MFSISDILKKIPYNKRREWKLPVDPITFVSIAFVIVIMAVFFREIFIVSLLLIGVLAISISTQALNQVPINLELVLFTCIVTGMAYGSKAGAILGLVAVLLHYAGSLKISDSALIIIPGVVLAGYVAGFLAGTNVAVTGFIIVLAYDLIVYSCLILFFGRNPVRAIFNGGTDILFNLFLFRHIAPTLMRVIA